MSGSVMRRDMHSCCSQGCSCSMRSCRSSHSMTAAGGGRVLPVDVFSTSLVHAPGERVILLFFFIFSLLGGVGERVSFLVFFAISTGEAVEGTLVSAWALAGSLFLRGRPPLAPLARRVSRRWRASSMGGLNRAKASLRPELFRCCSASSPQACAASALNSRPSSLLLSDAATRASRPVSTGMLSVVFILVLVWFLSFFLAANIRRGLTLPPCQKAQPLTPHCAAVGLWFVIICGRKVVFLQMID